MCDCDDDDYDNDDYDDNDDDGKQEEDGGKSLGLDEINLRMIWNVHLWLNVK